MGAAPASGAPLNHAQTSRFLLGGLRDFPRLACAGRGFFGVHMSQYTRLGKLLQRKRGVTAMEIIREVGTVCPHKRMSEMKERGWLILRQDVPGQNYGRYFGKPLSKKS